MVTIPYISLKGDDDLDSLEEAYEVIENFLKKRYYGWEGRGQFDGTAERLVRSLHEFCWTPQAIKEEVDKAFKSEFDYAVDEMLVEGPIDVWTLCPHHLLPCRLIVYIGYIPSGQVLGLSKFARVAVALGKRPVIQEMYTRELADAIDTCLKPKGVGVFVVGQHACMQARGIKQQANVTTAVLLGAIRDKLETRAEFYSLVRERNGK